MNKKGFTLIELLIVIAIIAILAAIAIPQFSQYRMRGFNASAQSDARNWKLSEEAMNTAFSSYGHVENAILPGGGAFGVGASPLMGALSAGTLASAGAILSTTWVPVRNPLTPQPGGLGVGIGNNIQIWAQNVVSTDDPNLSDQAQVRTKHFEGDTEFGTDTDSTAVYWCKNITFAKKNLPQANYPALTVNVDDFNPGALVNCGGDAIGTWSAL